MRRLALAGLYLLATSAHADPYRGLVVFGDSLMDSGNIVLGNNPGLKFVNRIGPDYLNSPFGPIAVEQVADQLGFPRPLPSVEGGNNYAVGGNIARQVFESITADTQYLGGPIGTPTFPRPYDSYFLDLRQSGGGVDPNALYVLDGGGNDIIVAGISTQAAAEAAGQFVLRSVDALDRAGARYIVYLNTADVGNTPFAQSGGIAANATLVSAAINRTVRDGLAQRDSNVIVVDIFGLQNEVIADPGAFGFPLSGAQLVTTCFDSIAGTPNCQPSGTGAEITGPNPEPSVFLFSDDVHPTVSGYGIFADQLLAILRAPGEIALLPQMGIDSLRGQWQSVAPTTAATRWEQRLRVASWRLYGNYQRADVERDLVFDDTEGDHTLDQLAFGVNYRLSEQWYLGGQLAGGSSDLELNASDSRYDLDSMGASVFAGYRAGRWFADAILSYGDLDYDQLRRRFELGASNLRTEQGSTEGSAWGASLTGGWNVLPPDQPVRFGPLVGYEYIDVSVDGYSERSGRSTALVFGDLDRESSVWLAGAFADATLAACDCRLRGEVAYRSEQEDDLQSVDLEAVTVPGNTFTLPGFRPEDDYWTWDVGFNLQVAKGIDLDIAYGRREGDETADWVTASVGFNF